MNCPYCGQEMRKGILRSPQELAWLNCRKNPMLGRASLHEGSVVLSELNLLKGSVVWAWDCRACGKIVIDYADGAQDYNRRRE